MHETTSLAAVRLAATLLGCCHLGLAAHAQEAKTPQTDPGRGPPTAPPASKAVSVARRFESRIQELEKQVKELRAKAEAEDLEKLRSEARSEANVEREAKAEDREHHSGGLALQKLNPEISVFGDVLFSLIIDGTKFYAAEEDRSGMPIRSVGLHFQHVLDPYSFFKSALHIDPHHGVHVEEVYVSWSGLVRSLTVSVGRFRQSFGILNRWHEHDLDQAEYPMALRLVLGDEGLIGTGIMIKWFLPPLWAHANELTLEIVDGDNETLFAGELFSIPSTMLHLKNYWDLSRSTYLEIGLTGMFGFNNRRGALSEQGEMVDEAWRWTAVAGADLTLYWSPLQQTKYKSFTWRTEFYYAFKELPPESLDQQRHSWGAYSYLQYQLGERWFIGLRGDAVLPTLREDDQIAWAVLPYVTFWQSEFVYLRLEYRHGQNIPYLTAQGSSARRTDDRVLLQVNFAAGPHKHEKY